MNPNGPTIADNLDPVLEPMPGPREAVGGPDREAGAIVVSPMRRRHLRSVLKIEQAVYPRAWTMGMYLGELAIKNSRVYLVARSGTEVVGYAGLMLVVDEGHVTTVAVHPDWRRREIATRLLLALCRRAVAIGADALTLEVRMSNKGAQELYRRFGFAPAGVRKNYYPEVNEDALIMWATGTAEATYRDRLASLERDLRAPLLLDGLWEQVDSDPNQSAGR